MSVKDLYNQINQTAADFPQGSLFELIEKQCQSSPNNIAVLWEDKTQTYSELSEKSNQLANHLRRKGIGQGDLVGLCSDRDIDLPALLLGIMKSGAGYVPLDPDYPVDRLVYMVENSEVKHIVGHSTQLSLIDQFNTPATIVDRDWDEVANAGSEDPRVKPVSYTHLTLPTICSV